MFHISNILIGIYLKEKLPIYEYLQQAIANKRRRIRKTLNSQRQADAENIAAGDINEDELKKELQFLKTMIVNDNNMTEIQRILIRTATLRSKMVEKKEVDFPTEFPFYFVCIDLVILKLILHLIVILKLYFCICIALRCFDCMIFP